MYVIYNVALYSKKVKTLSANLVGMRTEALNRLNIHW